MASLVFETLTAAAFAPFGDVLEAREGNFFHINAGMVERYHDLATVDVLGGNGRAGISVMRATPYALPMRAAFLERHPLSSQAFMPLTPTHFLVVVAPPGPEVKLADVRAFVCRPGQGVNYAPGVWHHMLLATEPCDFLIVDRIGAGPNCDEFYFPEDDRPIIGEWGSAVANGLATG